MVTLTFPGLRDILIRVYQLFVSKDVDINFLWYVMFRGVPFKS